MDTSNMLLIDKSVLPEIFTKVIQVKRLLQSGEKASTADACLAAGISRSAYYKYKDSVFEYDENTGRILTVHAVLCDRAGILSRFMSVLYESGANILTVNQNIPSNGNATVSVSFRIEKMSITPLELTRRLKAVDGVKSIQHIAGD